jgi:hypothetical protein
MAVFRPSHPERKQQQRDDVFEVIVYKLIATADYVKVMQEPIWAVLRCTHACVCVRIA